MRYAVSQGVRISRNGLVFIAGDMIKTGDLPGDTIAELLDAGSIVSDEPEVDEPRRGKK
jgi:hypothetical protein